MLKCLYRHCICLAMAIGAMLHVHASERLQISLVDADKIFLQKNLYLIADGLNIDVQKALEIQSRAYPNP